MQEFCNVDGRMRICKDEGTILRQSILNRLSTCLGEFDIYSFAYGNELLNILDSSNEIIQIKAEEYIESCILQDENISEVLNIKTEIVANGIFVEVDIVSENAGFLHIESEVLS